MACDTEGDEREKEVAALLREYNLKASDLPKGALVRTPASQQILACVAA